LGLFYRSLFSGIFIALIIVLGAGYTIWIVNRLLFGLNFKGLYLITDLTLKEFIISSLLIFPVILFGFNPMSLINLLIYSSSIILLIF
jgi:NADH-quinone oxidoreductase subunit M